MKKSIALGLVLTMSAIVSCTGKSDKLLEDKGGGDRSKVESDFEDPKIDILFVIDDSSSMDTHQQNLARNIGLFVDEIRKLNFIDYRIGVTSSSVDQVYNSNAPYGELYGTPNWVESSTPNGDAILRNNLIIGTGGSGTEEMFNPVYLALSPPMSTGKNAGFYRQNAHLAVIFITDADDQSNESSPNLDAQGLYNFLVQLKLGDTHKILGYGAFIPTGVSNCSRDPGSYSPKRLEEFMRIVNGQFFSLCDASFGVQLGGVAKNLVKEVTRVVRLKRWPVINTIRVVYGTQVVENDFDTGWVYEPSTNSILFGEHFVLSNQPAGTKLEITFTTARGE